MQSDQRARLAQVSLAHEGPVKIHGLGPHLLRHTLAAQFVKTSPQPLPPGPSPVFVSFLLWLLSCICSHMYFLPPLEKSAPPSPQGRALVCWGPFLSPAHRLVPGAQ